MARHYPDRGLIPDSAWYNSVLHLEPDADGLWGRLRSFEIATHRFGVVLSANADGLRIVLLLEQLAFFLPWSETTVSAQRSRWATRVCLRTRAAPSLTLVFHLDDTAADDLFQQSQQPLPPRDPSRRLALFQPGESVVFALVLGIAIAALVAALRF